MIGDWEVEFDLVTPAGTLNLNQTDALTGWRFQLDPAKCSTLLPVRTTQDDMPQADGQIPHRRWFSGYGAHLAIEPWISVAGELQAATGSDLVDMLDLLGLHKNAMIRTGLVSGLPNARLIWTPDGHANRMLDRCQLASAATLGPGTLGCVVYEFDIDTPYPYYISELETQTYLSWSGTEIIMNDGNTDGFAVYEVYGDTGYFELINHTVTDLAGNPLRLVYFAGLPGASSIVGPDYVEFVFFTGTAFLNGNQARRLAGVDFRYTTFFPLVPGPNLIEVTGTPSVIVKSNDYFA